MVEYQLDGETVEEVYESMRGDYWVVTESDRSIPFGYACLAGMRQFAEWGSLNEQIFEKSTVWTVPRENWSFTGPPQINIERVEE